MLENVGNFLSNYWILIVAVIIILLAMNSDRIREMGHAIIESPILGTISVILDAPSRGVALAITTVMIVVVVVVLLFFLNWFFTQVVTVGLPSFNDVVWFWEAYQPVNK
jgi:hypothetical protein